MQEQNNVISLKVLRAKSDVIGITRPVQISEEIAKPFDASNAKGNLRIVESFEKASKLGSESAESLMAAIV